MKTLLFSLVALGFSTAMAMPSIGDRVVYSIKQTAGAESQSVLFERKVTGMEGQNYQVTEVVTTPDGQSKTEVTTVAAADMVTDAQIDYVMENCQALQGTLAQQTYSFGTLNVCQVSEVNQQGTTIVAYAKVPFALVALTAKGSDSTTEVMIKEMSWGQK